MAEIKNTFLQSKMNKDLDSRLVPNGQYRNAQNININKSEGPDVGAIENVFGNFKITDFNLSDAKAEVIGSYFDNINERIYAFVTNYTDASIDRLQNNCATYPVYDVSTKQGVCCALLYYDFSTGNTKVLVFGSWLNLSLTHLIESVTLIENQLFWTDNRNQPRKINVDSAINNSYDLSIAGYNNPYYQNEDQISVAKYYPYDPIRVAVLGGITSAIKIAPAGATTTVGEVFNITDGGGTGGELVATDTVGNVIVQSPGQGYARSFDATTKGITFRVKSDGIGLMKDVVSKDLPATTTVTPIPGSYTRGSTIAVSPDINNNNFIGATVRVVDDTAFLSDVPSDTRLLNINSGGFGIVLSENVDLATLSQLVIGANPDYDPNYQGDEEVLKDDFVKFAYRFKFADNEYSLISPFTQACFIPKNWGYYLGGDFIETYESTVTKIMENLVNEIDFKIPAPDKIDQTKMTWAESLSLLHINSVDIIWKSSSSNNFRVLDTLDVSQLTNVNDTVLTYKYVARKPIRSLPESEITRVSDKVPVRAKTQESVGNRIVYGNFVQSLGRPKSLPYNVSVDEKFKDSQSSALEIASDPILRIEYPNHSVKQNRTYQVGIVLCDRYGRQSDVILSSNDGFNGAVGFQGSTLFHPYRNENQPLRPTIDEIWPGDSIKCLFQNIIPETNAVRGYAGLYKSDKSNPTGWYTYKIVVKQQEQEYYNAYLPGILNNYATLFAGSSTPAANPESQTVANVVLIGDNVNKIPRELQDVGPEQRQFSAEVNIFGRLDSGSYGSSLQYYPERTPDTVRIIGTFSDLNYDKTNPGVDGGVEAGISWIPEIPGTTTYTVSPFYNVPGNSRKDQSSTNTEMIVPFGDSSGSSISANDTLIAKISTSKELGKVGGGSIGNGNAQGNPWAIANPNATGAQGRSDVLWYKQPPLSVVEVSPVVSNLDIYYESSTSGRIKDLNTSILAGDVETPVGLERLFFDYNEGMAPLTVVSNAFRPIGVFGSGLNNPNTTVELISMSDGNGNLITPNLFEVVRDNVDNTFTLRIKADTYNVFLASSPVVDNYTLNFEVTNLGANGNTITSNITVNPPNLLNNVSPGWTDNGGGLGPAPTIGGLYYGGGQTGGFPFGVFDDPSASAPFNQPGLGDVFDVVNNRALHAGTYQDPFLSNPTLNYQIGPNDWLPLVCLSGFNGSYASGVNGIPFLIKEELVWKIQDVEFWWTGNIETDPNTGVMTSVPKFQTLSGAGSTKFSGGQKNLFTNEIPPNPYSAGGSDLTRGTENYIGTMTSIDAFACISNQVTAGPSGQSVPTQEFTNQPETVLYRLRALAHWYSDLSNALAAFPDTGLGGNGQHALNGFNATNNGLFIMPQYRSVYDYQNIITNTQGGSGSTQYASINPNGVYGAGNLRPYLNNVTPPASNQPAAGLNDTLYRITLDVFDAGDTSVSNKATIQLYFYVTATFDSSTNLVDRVDNPGGGDASGGGGTGGDNSQSG